MVVLKYLFAIGSGVCRGGAPRDLLWCRVWTLAARAVRRVTRPATRPACDAASPGAAGCFNAIRCRPVSAEASGPRVLASRQEHAVCTQVLFRHGPHPTWPIHDATPAKMRRQILQKAGRIAPGAMVCPLLASSMLLARRVCAMPWCHPHVIELHRSVICCTPINKPFAPLAWHHSCRLLAA